MTSRSVTSINLTVPGSLPRADGTPSTITATLDLPAEASSLTQEEFRNSGIPVAIAAHCFTCHRTAPGIFRISRALARAGIACVRCDFPGLGDSGPDHGGVPFEDTTFSSNVDDLVTISQWLGEHLSPPSLLVGHSLGGAAVLRAAPHIESVAAVVTVGAPFLPSRAALPLLPAFENPPDGDDTCQQVKLAGRTLLFRRRFLCDLAEQSRESPVRESIAALGHRGIQLLVMHSPSDQTVPISDAEEIFAAASWPKSLLSIPDADHLLTFRGSAQRVGESIATWTQAIGLTQHHGASHYSEGP